MSTPIIPSIVASSPAAISQPPSTTPSTTITPSQQSTPIIVSVQPSASFKPQITSNPVRCIISGTTAKTPTIVSTSPLTITSSKPPVISATKSISEQSPTTESHPILNTRKIIRTSAHSPTPSIKQTTTVSSSSSMSSTSNNHSSNLVNAISLATHSSVASSSSMSPTTPFQLISGSTPGATLTPKATPSVVASQSSAPKIILSSGEGHIKLTSTTTLTPPRIITSQSASLSTPRLITTTQLPANVTIHQIALNNHPGATSAAPVSSSSPPPQPSQNAPIIVTATNSGAIKTMVPTTTSTPIPVPHGSKINETLNKPTPAQILIDSAKLKSASGLSFVRSGKINTGSSGSATGALSTSLHLSEAQMQAKIAQANLISIINTGNPSAGFVQASPASANLMPQVTSILNQIQSTANRPVVAPTPQSQPSPSSSPLKPNIIRKAKPVHESVVRDSSNSNGNTAISNNTATPASSQEILVKEISKFPAFELYTNNQNSSNSSNSTTFTPILISDASATKQLLKQSAAINLDSDSNVIVDLRPLISNLKAQNSTEVTTKATPLSISNGNSIIITQQHQTASIKTGTSSKKIVNISKCATPPPTVQPVASKMPINTTITTTQPPQPLTTNHLNAIVDNIKSEPNEMMKSVKPKSKRKQEFKKTSDIVGNTMISALSNSATNVKASVVNFKNECVDENLIDDADAQLHDEDDEDEDEDDASPPPKISRLITNAKRVNKKQSNLISCVSASQPVRKLASQHSNKYLSSMANGKIGGKAQTIKNMTQHSHFNSYLLDDETVKQLSNEFVYEDKFGVRWVAAKMKPQITLSKFYKPSWKTRQNHFDHYSDIKIRDECKGMDELVDERQRLESLNEWRFHYVISQFEDLVNCENDSLSLIGEIESLVKAHCNINDFCEKIQDCIKANSQRHKYVSEELSEAQILVKNIIQHKSKFKEILNMANKEASSNSTADDNHLVANTSKVRNGVNNHLYHYHETTSSNSNINNGSSSSSSSNNNNTINSKNNSSTSSSSQARLSRVC